MNKKFIPVCTAYLSGNEKKYINDCIDTGWISSAGKYVVEFEKSFAKYCGCKYAVAVTSGTTALHLALVSLGIKKGDEVIILLFDDCLRVCGLFTGAKPVFVDLMKKRGILDVSKIEEKITKKQKR
jgi:perosamine synthetase